MYLWCVLDKDGNPCDLESEEEKKEAKEEKERQKTHFEKQRKKLEAEKKRMESEIKQWAGEMKRKLKALKDGWKNKRAHADSPESTRAEP
jgi:hypothetical protein